MMQIHRPKAAARAARCVAVLAIVLAGTVGPPASAQVFPQEEFEVVHRHARTGYPTINVYVWGAATLSGIWEVEETTGLVELLSAARPQGIGEQVPGIEQSVSVRLYRQSGATPGAAPGGGERGGADGGRTLIYESTLDALLTPSAALPGLADGDVVSVEIARRRPFSWRDAGGLIGAASSVVLLILRIATL